MDNNQSKTEIQLRLLKVQETGFFMDSVLLSTIEENKPDLFNIEFGLQLEPKVSLNILNLHLIVRYILTANSQSEKVVELQTSNSFEIIDLEKLMSISDSEITDNNSIIPTILGVALGTLRGILVVKTAGTILADFPLPIVNPTELCSSMYAKK
jgi:hypothetical protein